MTNQEFLALAVIEGNLENALNIIKAYDELFGDRGFEILVKKFLYDILLFAYVSVTMIKVMNLQLCVTRFLFSFEITMFFNSLSSSCPT